MFETRTWGEGACTLDNIPKGILHGESVFKIGTPAFKDTIFHHKTRKVSGTARIYDFAKQAQ